MKRRCRYPNQNNIIMPWKCEGWGVKENKLFIFSVENEWIPFELGGTRDPLGFFRKLISDEIYLPFHTHQYIHANEPKWEGVGVKKGWKSLHFTFAYSFTLFSLIFDWNTHRARAIKRVQRWGEREEKREKILFTLNTNAFEFMDFFRLQYFVATT
jgi:hypothetical protein